MIIYYFNNKEHAHYTLNLNNLQPFNQMNFHIKDIKKYVKH